MSNAGELIRMGRGTASVLPRNLRLAGRRWAAWRRTGRQWAGRRRGISLMEVIFALGIIIVGLVGVAVLIPVAGKLANDGTTADRAAREGLNAIREMEVRGMGRPLNWIHLADGLDNNGNGTVDEPAEISSGSVPSLTGFCLDPRFIAANRNQILGNGSGGPLNPDPRFFPYVDLGSEPLAARLRMRRITLLDPTQSPALMSLLMANDLFTAQDDLVTTIPGVDNNLSPTLPPQQNYGDLGDKRQSEGRISWFATFAPANDGDNAQDVYLMSVVVFLNRDAAMLLNGVSERVATIPHTAQFTGFHGGGVTGGDVSLMVRNNRPATDLDLKRGQWVMLARNSGANVNGTTVFTGPIFRWYKVMEVDPDVADSKELSGTPPSGTIIRHTTLYGPDWVPDVNFPTLVYIVPDVIAVYEKQIRLENTSLWTP
ncbi:MAG: hypothetical protein ACKOU6_03275 [Planctomycetota bacterium]